jgi:YD repeat-containing protein
MIEDAVNEGKAYPTSYGYTANDDLKTVTQGGTTRNFGLGRMVTARNPETGMTAISYGYDGNGNVTTRTDTRGITTSYSYDALNRLTKKTYAGAGTAPAVTYCWDGKKGGSGDGDGVCSASTGGTNAMGRMTEVR